jgi:GDP-L-fucose synthase
MNKNSKIYVAGHLGLVGSAIMRKLKTEGYNNIIVRTRHELDLTDQSKVKEFFNKEKPEYVFLGAAKVGGIMANKNYPAEFIYSNLVVATNVVDASYKNNVKKLIFLGSSCIYPKLAPQPIKEEYLLSSPLELSNEAYAIAKIAGLKLCQYYNQQYGTNYIAVMPTNLYGPNDNFNLNDSHVLPAMIRKFHEAKVNNKATITLWGSGQAKREFLHVDDLADALLFLMKSYNGKEIINIGTGSDLSIKELANTIKQIVDFTGEINWDKTKPDGTPRKLLDVSKLEELGWRPQITLEKGLKTTYEWFLNNQENLRK